MRYKARTSQFEGHWWSKGGVLSHGNSGNWLVADVGNQTHAQDMTIIQEGLLSTILVEFGLEKKTRLVRLGHPPPL